MDTNVGWVVDSKILSCEGADREQDDVGQENAEETLVAETHPESPRKTLDAEDSRILGRARSMRHMLILRIMHFIGINS